MKKKFIFFPILLITIFTCVLLVTNIISYKKTIGNYAFNNQKISTEKSLDNLISKNDQSQLPIKETTNNIYTSNNTGNVLITIPQFINDMQCKEYTLKDGETLTSIAKNYISTCPLNSGVKLIKEASKINNADLICAGSKILIPETILKNGYIHKIEYGDTWNKLCRYYYSIYNSEYMKKLLIFINDFPDTTLPLGTEIYMPNINI